MNMESIVQRCTEKFSNKLRAALEEAEQQGAEGVTVEIKIHIADEDEPFSEERRVQYGALRNGRGKLLERLERELGLLGLTHLRTADLGDKFAVEKEVAEDAEDAEDARGRMEAALLEYIERLAAGDTYLDEGQAHHLVDAAELLDKLLSKREK